MDTVEIKYSPLAELFNLLMRESCSLKFIHTESSVLKKAFLKMLKKTEKAIFAREWGEKPQTIMTTFLQVLSIQPELKNSGRARRCARYAEIATGIKVGDWALELPPDDDNCCNLLINIATEIWYFVGGWGGDNSRYTDKAVRAGVERINAILSIESLECLKLTSKSKFLATAIVLLFRKHMASKLECRIMTIAICIILVSYIFTRNILEESRVLEYERYLNNFNFILESINCSSEILVIIQKSPAQLKANFEDVLMYRGERKGTEKQKSSAGKILRHLFTPCVGELDEINRFRKPKINIPKLQIRTKSSERGLIRISEKSLRRDDIDPKQIKRTSRFSSVKKISSLSRISYVRGLSSHKSFGNTTTRKDMNSFLGSRLDILRKRMIGKELMNSSSSEINQSRLTERTTSKKTPTSLSSRVVAISAIGGLKRQKTTLRRKTTLKKSSVGEEEHHQEFVIFSLK